MPFFDWNNDKNESLQQSRGIGFNDIVEAINSGDLLTAFRHPDTSRAHQSILIVAVLGYAYAVPCVIDSDKVFLKTIYPSRKMTKQYLRKDSK